MSDLLKLLISASSKTKMLVMVKGVNLRCTAKDCGDRNAPVFAVYAYGDLSGDVALKACCEACHPSQMEKAAELYGDKVIMELYDDEQ